MTDRRHAQRRVTVTSHTPERRHGERRCIGCGTAIAWRTTAWCSPGCRTKFLADHPDLRPDVRAASVHTRLVAVVEFRFQQAKRALRRASAFTVDPWAQRPGGGRGMEDWGSEE